MNLHTAPQLTNWALDKALAIAQQAMGNLQLIDWKLGYLEIAAHRGFSPHFVECFRIVKESDGCACGRAFRLRDTVVIDDVANDVQFLPFREAAQEAGFRSVQSTPIISASGAFLGMISTHGSRSPSSEQLRGIKALARETANELIRSRSHAEDPVVVAHEAIARANELLNQPMPDTFLGKQRHKFIPLPGE